MTTNKKVTGIRIPKELDRKLTNIASYLGYTKNGLIVQILWEYVNRMKK